MRININPVNVETEGGVVVCSEADVSVAVSSSVAIRVVPVGPDGKEYPEGTMGVVGTQDQQDIVDFMASLAVSLDSLLEARGI